MTSSSTGDLCQGCKEVVFQDHRTPKGTCGWCGYDPTTGYQASFVPASSDAAPPAPAPTAAPAVTDEMVEDAEVGIALAAFEDAEGGAWRDQMGAHSREDFMRAALSALARYRAALANTGAPVREGWQPIETAPKDGTEVDLWDRGVRFTDCHFHQGEWLQWASSSVDEEPHWRRIGTPTHWMPFPEPPQ